MYHEIYLLTYNYTQIQNDYSDANTHSNTPVV